MTPTIDLNLDGDGAWRDLVTMRPERIVNLMDAEHGLSMTVLPHGTIGGRPAVGIRIDLPDGRVVVTQTTLRLLVISVRAMVARYGDPTEDHR